MNTFVYYAIRTHIFVRDTIATMCCPRRRKPTAEYVETWSRHKDFLMRHVTQTKSDVTKIAIYTTAGKPDFNPSEERMFDQCIPPWYFVGSTENGSQVDHTADMDPYITPGNVIHLKFLYALFPNSTRWVYIHPETFEETDFPSEGISIRHVC